MPHVIVVIVLTLIILVLAAIALCIHSIIKPERERGPLGSILCETRDFVSLLLLLLFPSLLLLSPLKRKRKESIRGYKPLDYHQ